MCWLFIFARLHFRQKCPNTKMKTEKIGVWWHFQNPLSVATTMLDKKGWWLHYCKYIIQPPIGKTCRHFLYVRTYNKHSRTSFPRVHKKWMREKSAAFRLWCRQFSLLLFGFSSERSRNVDELVVNDSSFWEGSNPTGDANKWRRVTKKCHENVIIQSNEIWNTLPKCHLSVELLRRRHRCGRWFKIYRNLIKLISK